MDIGRFKYHGKENLEKSFGKNYKKKLKQIGIDLGVTIKENEIEHKDPTHRLYLLVSILTDHLVIRHLGVNGTLLADKESFDKWIKYDITKRQYKLMLLYYYRHTVDDIKRDILLNSYETSKENTKYKSLALSHFINRITIVKNYVEQIKRRRKNKLENQYSAEEYNILNQFITIHNSCCESLKLSDHKI